MKCYHRTTVESAERILSNGFVDTTGYYLTGHLHRGVWLSADAPLTCNEGAKGEIVLEVAIPEDVFEAYEWQEEGKPYREALIPAGTVNCHGPPVIADHDWDGCSRSHVQQRLYGLVKLGHNEEEARLRDIVLPFLERHDLLAPEED